VFLGETAIVANFFFLNTNGLDSWFYYTWTQSIINGDVGDVGIFGAYA
jgi:hypothetical protein